MNGCPPNWVVFSVKLRVEILGTNYDALSLRKFIVNGWSIFDVEAVVYSIVV